MSLNDHRFNAAIRDRHLKRPPVKHVTVSSKPIPKPIRILFLLFVFTLPFEEVDVGFMTGSLSLSKICGFLFFASYLFYYNPLFTKRSFPPIPHAMWWFLAYIGLDTLNGFLDSVGLLDNVSYPGTSEISFVSRVFTFTQLAILFWIASGLLREQKLARSALTIFVIASVLMAIGVVMQIPAFHAEVGEGRGTVLSENPNAVATNLGLGVVIIIGLLLYTPYRRSASKTFLLMLTLPLLAGMAVTGSRGGVLAFFAGCAVYLLPHWRSKRLLTTMSLVAVSIGAAAYMISRNPEFTERWQYTYYEGDTTGRDVIFREAMGMILEQPIFGWSSGGAFYELGRRVGLPNGRDAHNLILTVLLGVGFFGALPFFVGLWMCGRGAWRARFGNLELLPMALFATLFAAGLSGTTLLGKTQWFVLGLTLAATSSSVREVAVKRVAVSLAVQSFRRRSFVTSRFSH